MTMHLQILHLEYSSRKRKRGTFTNERPSDTRESQKLRRYVPYNEREMKTERETDTEKERHAERVIDGLRKQGTEPKISVERERERVRLRRLKVQRQK